MNRKMTKKQALAAAGYVYGLRGAPPRIGDGPAVRLNPLRITVALRDAVRARAKAEGLKFPAAMRKAMQLYAYGASAAIDDEFAMRTGRVVE